MRTLQEQMAFVQLQIEQWSEDVAMGGGTGVYAFDHLFHDPLLRDACARVEMYEAILVSLETFASSRTD